MYRSLVQKVMLAVTSGVLIATTGCGAVEDIIARDDNGIEPCAARMEDERVMVFRCDEKNTETRVAPSQLWQSSPNSDSLIKQTVPLNGGARIVNHSQVIGGGYRIVVQDETGATFMYTFDSDTLESVELLNK